MHLVGFFISLLGYGPDAEAASASLGYGMRLDGQAEARLWAQEDGVCCRPAVCPAWVRSPYALLGPFLDESH